MAKFLYEYRWCRFSFPIELVSDSTPYKTMIPSSPFRMPIEFQTPCLRVQVTEQLDEEQSEQIQKEHLLNLEENRLQSMWHLEQKQRWTKAFVDPHWNSKKNLFDIGKPVLVFETKMGSMPEKLHFRWTGCYGHDQIISRGENLPQYSIHVDKCEG